MSEYWRRHCRVQCAARVFDLATHDIEFTLSGGNASNADTGTVTLYNLANVSLSEIKKGDAVQIEAGYADDYGIVFYGLIDAIKNEVDGSDVRTVLTVKDHTKLLQDTVPLVRTFPKGTRLAPIVEAVYLAAGIPPGILIDGGYALRRPLTLAEPPAKAIKTLLNYINGRVEVYSESVPAAERVRYTAYVQNGQGYFVPETYTGANVVLVDSESGLLTVTEKTDKTATVQTLTVSTLFQWRARADTPIQLNSTQFKGFYKVTEYNHTCNTGDFLTTLTVTAL